MTAVRSRIHAGIGALNPFRARGARATPSPASSAPPPAALHTQAEDSPLNLVNYSPEELVQQVDHTLAQVHFGMSLPHRFKEVVAELWAVLGPIALFAGTAGEVYFFIWNNMTGTAVWWVALSVFVTVAVLECTFMVLSYKCDTLRNQLKNHPGGGTDEEQRDLAAHHRFWLILAAGVAFGQISFLVFSMEAKFSHFTFLLAFAIGRSVVTLAADYYTAFIHRAKPTTGEVAKARLKERADLTADLLRQKGEEVTILNTGILHLREAHTDALIKEDQLVTRLEVERLQNHAQVETLRQQQEQATMFTRLGNSMMRALFDPEMPESERQRLLDTMQAFMSAGQALPSARVEELREPDTGDL